MPEIIVIAHDIRSAHNIGSIMRTCEGLGVKRLILSGYSPHPKTPDDIRLPHVISNATRKIQKTALGAEKYLDWEYSKDVSDVISQLKASGYQIAALEQSPKSIDLNEFKPSSKVAVILGSELDGIGKEILKESNVIIEIKMKGKKESFNVAVAAAMCLYKLSSVK